MEENSELLNPNEERADPHDSIEADNAVKSSRSWWPYLQLLGAYLVGAWTLLQFLDWVFARYQISPYWVDLFMWIFIGLLPSFLFYLLYKERIDRFGSNRKDKFVFSSNLVILVLVLEHRKHRGVATPVLEHRILFLTGEDDRADGDGR